MLKLFSVASLRFFKLTFHFYLVTNSVFCAKNTYEKICSCLLVLVASNMAGDSQIPIKNIHLLSPQISTGVSYSNVEMLWSLVKNSRSFPLTNVEHTVLNRIHWLGSFLALNSFIISSTSRYECQVINM